MSTYNLICNGNKQNYYECQVESGYPNVRITFHSQDPFLASGCSNEFIKNVKKAIILCRKYFHTIRRRDKHDFLTLLCAIALSVAMLFGNQGSPRSILASGTSFREDLVIKLFLRPFFLFR